MMEFRELYQNDIAFIQSKKDHLGGDHWTTADSRIGKGSPFSARDVAIMLSELGFGREDEEIRGLASVMFSTWLPDGRFRITPKGTIFPCHTITILRALCYMGFAEDERLSVTFDHLMAIRHTDGGWRCNKVKLGRNEVTDASNPGVTLESLDAFRYSGKYKKDDRLYEAVGFLLDHWDFKRPLGPCQFGIGSLFMQTEFPFLRYNLFYYCYVLSFYDCAKEDSRFRQALKALAQKVVDGEMIIENPHRLLARMDFCRKGRPSAIATKKYNELKKRSRVG